METGIQENLFYKDPRTVNFEALVTQCTRNERTGKYEIVLDRTAFFPEEGGQTADAGTLNGKTVLDAQIRKEVIFHIMKEELPVGTAVQGRVDWAQRFDFMQQHSGEHIISGLVSSRHGLDNVGFHLSRSEVTLDFNGPLTLKQLREIEREANAAVWQDLPIQISYPAPEELKRLPYRSKKELTGTVRIVEIPGVDICACCAPHVDRTGQIGLVKITNVQSHRGGVRVNILCGARAAADYTAKQDSVTAVSVLLSAKQDAVFDAVKRLKEEGQRTRELANTLQERLLELQLDALPSPKEAENAILFTGRLDGIAMRNAVNRLCEAYPGWCAIFSEDGGGAEGGSGQASCRSYRFVLGSRLVDCGVAAALLRERFHAKCGGSSLMIQGSVTASEKELRDCLSVL